MAYLLAGLPGAPLQGVAEQPSAQSKAEVKREMPAGSVTTCLSRADGITK